MAKYRVEKTDILHNKKLYPQGSEIELEEKDAEKLNDYLVPIQVKEPKTTKTKTNTTKTTSNNSKTTPKTNQKETKNQPNPEGGEE